MRMTVSDLKHQYLLDNTAQTNGSIEDLEWLYYATSGRSGLVPAIFYSIADHKRAYFETQTGLSGKTLQYLERAYWALQGVPSGSYSDMANYFYDFSPYRLPSIELALDASSIGSVLTDGSPVAQWNDLSGKGRHVTQAVGTKQPLFRNANPNLLTYGTALAIDAARIIANTAFATVSVDPLGYKVVATAGAIATTGVTVIDSPVTVVVPGSTITLLATANQSIGAANLRLLVSWRDVNGTFIVDAPSAPFVVGAADTQLSLTILVPANAYKVYVKVSWYTAPAVGDTFYVSKLQVSNNSVVTPWVAPVTLPNNLPTVQFDGLGSYLSGVLAGQATSTVYVVCIVDAQKSLSEAVFNLKMGGTDLQRVLVNGPANYRKDIVDDLAAFVVTSVPVDATKYVVISSRISPNKTNVNGGVDIVGGGGAMTVPMSDITLGAREVVPDGFLAGSISAFLVFSTSHDDATRKRIEKWLGAKYGISVA